MNKWVRYVVHGALFLVAILVFYAGLGVGLQYNPTLGTVLWIAAVVIAVLNIYWLSRRRSR